MPTQLSRTESRRFFILVLALILSAVFVKTAAAQSGQPVSDDDVNKIAHELFCPICENTPLDVCPTQACADWREIIRTKLSEGQTEQQIKSYFEEQYGPRALAEPPREGFTLAVWIVPIVAIIVGGFFFTRYMRSLKSASTPTTIVQEPSAPVSAPNETLEPNQDDYTARIERELQERTK